MHVVQALLELAGIVLVYAVVIAWLAAPFYLIAAAKRLKRLVELYEARERGE